MNTIQLGMTQIPKHVKTALKFLGGKYPHNVLTRLLPMILGNINATSTKCVSVTKTTEDEFTRVRDLIDEVLLATTSTESQHKKQVELNEVELQILRSQKEQLAQEEKRRTQRYNEATAAANRAEETYYQALKDIPTGWDKFFQDLGRCVLKLATTVAEAGANLMTSKIGQGMLTGNLLSRLKRSTGNNGNGQTASFGFSQTIEVASRFSDSLKEFQTLISTENPNAKKVAGFSVVCRVSREYLSTLPNNAAKAKVIGLIERSERLVKKASENIKQKEINTEVHQEILTEIEEIHNALLTFQSADQLTDRTNVYSGQSNTQSADSAHEQGGSSDNEVLRARVAQQQLVGMRQRQDAYAAELSQLLEQARLTSSKMLAVDLSTLNYQQIIVMLKDAFELLDKLRQQWHHIVLFFQEMSERVKYMVEHSLRRFLQTASVAQGEDIALRLQFIRDLKGDTFSIHSQAYTLYVLSRTYYDVSSKYLMGRLSTLSNMLVSRSETERNEMMQVLKTEAEQSLEQINGLILERKQTFDQELKKRYTELNELIDQLGGPNEEDQHVIDEANQLINDDKAWGDE